MIDCLVAAVSVGCFLLAVGLLVLTRRG